MKTYKLSAPLTVAQIGFELLESLGALLNSGSYTNVISGPSDLTITIHTEGRRIVRIYISGKQGAGKTIAANFIIAYLRGKYPSHTITLKGDGESQVFNPHHQNRIIIQTVQL